MKLTTDQLNELDLGLQKVARMIANGYSSGIQDTGLFFIKYNIPRGTDNIDINIQRRDFSGKV